MPSPATWLVLPALLSGALLPCLAQTAPAAPEPGKPQVLFERSTDAASAQAKNPPAKGPAAAVTDPMRLAPAFTAYDLEVHLNPADASLAVEARVTLRNAGAQPLTVLPLQLSSTLHMERVSLAGVPLPLTQSQIASDADHTGKLEETAVALPQPLAPGASLDLSIAYSGTISPSAARLDQLETPAAIAESSDWDRISGDFTGLRGFGDVVWYPVCSVPAMLGDGAKLFTEIGRQRAQGQDATIAIHVTDEFSGSPPTIAVLAGHALDPGAPQAMPSDSFPGVLRFDLPATRLGFRTPSLFLAARAATGTAADPLRVYSTSDRTADAQAFLTAATLVQPLLNQWLGTGSATVRQLAVISLPVEGAQPSEQGDAVLVSLVAAEPPQIAPLLSQELAHARFHAPRVWLDEGVPALMGLLYREQTEGHTAALEQLAGSRTALALIEPASPGTSSGQDLIHAQDAIYYRAKALDVLWMLRALAGDKPLIAALKAYNPAADTQPEYFEKLLEQASSEDLKWFFDAWVYHDLGLPDLSITNVYFSRSTEPDQWLVSVDIANDGYAEAEVPVTVHSATTAVTERVRIDGRSKISHRMIIVGQPTSVDVNDGTVPEVQASIHQRLIE